MNATEKNIAYFMLYTWLFNFRCASEKNPAIQVELEPSTTSKRMVFLLGNWAGLPNLGKLWQAEGYTAAANDVLQELQKNATFSWQRMCREGLMPSHAIFKRHKW